MSCSFSETVNFIDFQHADNTVFWLISLNRCSLGRSKLKLQKTVKSNKAGLSFDKLNVASTLAKTTGIKQTFHLMGYNWFEVTEGQVVRAGVSRSQ